MDKILEILKEINSHIDYTKETNLIDGKVIDSLELMEIISELEAAYGIRIDMEDIIPENFNSAEAMLNLVNRLKS